MQLARVSLFVLSVAFTGFFACGGGDETKGGDGDSGGDGDGDSIGDGDSAGDGDGDSGGDGGGDSIGDGDLPGEGGAPGDGDLGGSPGDGDGDGGADVLTSNPSDSECNLSGVWAVVTKTRTTAASMDQIANRWYLLEISHDGDDVEVVRASNCQVRVEDDNEIIGTTVTISEDALRGILEIPQQQASMGPSRRMETSVTSISNVSTSPSGSARNSSRTTLNLARISQTFPLFPRKTIPTEQKIGTWTEIPA